MTEIFLTDNPSFEQIERAKRDMKRSVSVWYSEKAVTKDYKSGFCKQAVGDYVLHELTSKDWSNYTVKEIAKILGVSTFPIYNRIRQLNIKVKKCK